MYKGLAMLLLFYSILYVGIQSLYYCQIGSLSYINLNYFLYKLIAGNAFIWPIHHPNPLLLAVYYMINDLSLYINILHCMFELTRVADENRGLNPYSAPLPQHHTPYT